MTHDSKVLYLRPYIDARRAADAGSYEDKLAVAQEVFHAAKADLAVANGAIETAEIDSHDCRIIRSRVGFVESITTECCYGESGCGAA